MKYGLRDFKPFWPILLLLMVAAAQAALAFDCPNCGAELRIIEPVVLQEPEYDLYGLDPALIQGFEECRWCPDCGWAGFPGDHFGSVPETFLRNLGTPSFERAAILERAAELHQLSGGDRYTWGLARLRAAWANRAAGDADGAERNYAAAYGHFTAYVENHATGSILPWARYLAGACAERLGRLSSALTHYRAAQYMGDLPLLLREFVGDRLWDLGF
jgi:hypothetical protein